MLLSGEINAFKYYISVGENYIDSETRVNSYRADKIKVVMSADLDVRPTVHFASIIVDYFKAYIPFGELIDVNYNVEDHEAGLFEYDITVDNLEVDADILDATASEINLNENIEECIDSDIQLVEYDSDGLITDIKIDDIYTYASMYNITGGYFGYHITVDGDTIFTPYVTSYQSRRVTFKVTVDGTVVPSAVLLSGATANFMTHLVFNDELDILPKVVNSDADLLRHNIGIDDITFDSELIPALPNSFSAEMNVGDIKIKPTVCITFIPVDTFRFFAVFTDDISVVPHVERHTAKRIRTRTKFDDELLMTTVFSFMDVDLFNAHLIFDDTVINTKFVTERATADIFGYTDYINNVINITPSIDSFTADDIIIHSIFDDELDTDIIINTNDADMIKYSLDISQEIEYNSIVSDSTAEIFSVDNYLDLDFDFTAELEVTAVIVDLFSTYIPATFSLPFDTVANSYEANDVNFDVNSNADVISQVIDGIFSDAKYRISVDADQTDTYTLIDSTSESIIFNSITNNTLNGEISSSTAEIFGYVENDFTILDTFEAELTVSQSPAEVFAFNFAHYSDFYSTADVYESVDLNYFVEDYNFNFESTFETGEVNDYGFDLKHFEHFDVSSVAVYEPTDFDLSVIVENESDEYLLNAYESISTIATIKNTITEDRFTAALWASTSPIVFDFEIVNDIITDEFDADVLDCIADYIDYNMNIDFDMSATTKFTSGSINDFTTHLVFDDDIISNPSFGGWMMCEPTDLEHSNCNINFELNSEAYVDVIVALIDWIPTYITANPEFEMSACPYLQDTDLIRTYFTIEDTEKYRIRPVCLDADIIKINVFDDMNYDTHACFNAVEELNFKTIVTNVVTSDVESYFCYSTFAKLNEYNDLTYTLGGASDGGGGATVVTFK